MSIRLLVLVGLIFAALFLPWWVTVPLVIGAILAFRDFFEGFIILFYLDLMVGVDSVGWHNYFVLTLGGLLFLLTVETARQMLLVRN